MKTSKFSFDRLMLLFSRYFAERKQTEAIYWGIMILAFCFMRNWITGTGMLIFVAGVFYAARFLREIHSSTNGPAYFMLPATQLEKMTVAIVMTHFYYFAMMMVCYVIGNLLGTAFTNLMASVPFIEAGYMEINDLFFPIPLQWVLFEVHDGHWPFTGVVFWSVFFKIFLVLQSVFLLGGIYFKNNQVFKTLFVTNVVQVALFVLFVLEMKLFVGEWESLEHMSQQEGKEFFAQLGRVMSGVALVFMAFFWIVSYVCLTEKER
jgi:hypothetical protein